MLKNYLVIQNKGLSSLKFKSKMRESMSFAEGFLGPKNSGTGNRTFDWDLAAEIIKKAFAEDAGISVEAGLQTDWSFTAGTIFENGKPTNESYTYLGSSWACPSLIISFSDGKEQEIQCFKSDGADNRFNEKSKWDETSLETLGLSLAD